MRYAVTFTTDDTWNTADTLILETDTSPVDMNNEQLMKMFESYTSDTDMADEIVRERERWFCRNLEDTDVFMRGDM